jgi:hypothetical protein
MAGSLEREGLLVTDDDNDYLALNELEDALILQIQGYSIIYRIAAGKQQGRKVFTLQIIAPKAHQTLGRRTRHRRQSQNGRTIRLY